MKGKARRAAGNLGPHPETFDAQASLNLSLGVGEKYAVRGALFPGSEDIHLFAGDVFRCLRGACPRMATEHVFGRRSGEQVYDPSEYYGLVWEPSDQVVGRGHYLIYGLRENLPHNVRKVPPADRP